MERAEPTDTILVVDDQTPVRQTMQEWLGGAHLGCRILTAGSAEEALELAENHVIDLAVLDWNLEASGNGLQLLRDLRVFHPDVVAILVTGYANLATPLDAMRMGVRDYLDKNREFQRDRFVAVVRQQLELLRPAKAQRRIHHGLLAFREALDRVLPLVQAASTLHDPVSLPDAIRSLFRFLARGTGARDGVLLVRHYDPERQPPELLRAYDVGGQSLDSPLVPFSQSIAGAVVSLQRPSTMTLADPPAGLHLQPFEQGRLSLLAAPVSSTPGLQMVLELFDKEGPGGKSLPFTDADCHLAGAAADFAGEILRQTLAEHQARNVLLQAVEAAVAAGDRVASSLHPPAPGEPAPAHDPAGPVSPDVLQRLTEGLEDPASPLRAVHTVRLAEAIRVLALRYGAPAVNHCIRLMEGVRELLDRIQEGGESDDEVTG
jgi:ActR/RegA family two-component response regulator